LFTVEPASDSAWGEQEGVPTGVSILVFMDLDFEDFGSVHLLAEYDKSSQKYLLPQPTFYISWN
jgi:hypothetical protein